MARHRLKKSHLSALACICILFFSAASQASPAENARVTVSVKDAADDVIPGAHLSFAAADRKQAVEAITGLDGVATLELQQGSYEMTTSFPGFATGTKQLTISGNSVQSFTVELQIASTGGGPIVSNPYESLQLWTPSLDGIWVPVVETIETFH